MPFGQNQGILTTTDVNASMQVIDFDKQLALLNPNISTLYSMATFLKRKKPTDSYKFWWDEDRYLPHYTQINLAAGYTATDLSFVVDDSSIFKVGDLVKVARTGEVLNIATNTIGTNTITVAARAFGTTSAAAMVDDDYLVRIGNANEEGGAMLTSVLTTTISNYNVTQIFKHSVDISKTEAATKNRAGGDERSRQRAKVGIDHALDIDRALLLGEYKVYTGGTEVKRTTAGLLAQISTNVTTDANGVLTRDEWDEWLMYQALLYKPSSGRKLILVGDIFTRALANWLEDKVYYDPKYEKLGLQVVSYKLPNGEEVLIKGHQLFSDIPDYRGMAVAIDMNGIAIRTLRPTKLLTDRPTTADKFLDEYVTELGLQVTLEQNFALYKGVTSYAKA